MSPRALNKRIEDLLSCARNIQDFTSGMSFDLFLSDPITIRAVAFELITMGEAVRAIPKEVQDKNPEVPWAKMLGIRNVLVHEYFCLDEEILWKTCQDDIPVLIETLEKIGAFLNH